MGSTTAGLADINVVAGLGKSVSIDAPFIHTLNPISPLSGEK